MESLPTSGRATEPAGSRERLQHFTQTLVLDRQCIAEPASREHGASGQKLQHPLLEAGHLSIPSQL